MPRRKTGEEHIRTLTKLAGGGSYGITLPMEYVKKLGWRSKQKLEVKIYGDRLVIKDWKE